MANVTFRENTQGNQSKNSTALGALDYFAQVAVSFSCFELHLNTGGEEGGRGLVPAVQGGLLHV